MAVINHRHGTTDWMPIDLRLRDDFEEAVALYKHYDLLLVNAMWDGMNLVSKEGPLVNTRDGMIDPVREHGRPRGARRVRAVGQPVRRAGAGRRDPPRADRVRRGAPEPDGRPCAASSPSRTPGRLDRRASSPTSRRSAPRPASERARRHGPNSPTAGAAGGGGAGRMRPGMTPWTAVCAGEAGSPAAAAVGARSRLAVARAATRGGACLRSRGSAVTGGRMQPVRAAPRGPGRPPMPRPAEAPAISAATSHDEQRARDLRPGRARAPTAMRAARRHNAVHSRAKFPPPDPPESSGPPLA